jgi:histo-blood group ABO system transferase
MMTGKYTEYFPKLKESFDKHFLPKKSDDETYEIHYFIFTDGKISVSDDTTVIPQKRLGWPFDSMMRFEIYYNASAQYKDTDYLFSVDADLQAVNDVTPEQIISDLTGTRHPGYPAVAPARNLPYDNHVTSGSYIGDDEGSSHLVLQANILAGYYHFGAFWGGKTHHVLQMCKTIRRRIHGDLANEVIPAWHDESHLNRYFLDNPPPITLEAGIQRHFYKLTRRLCYCRG